MLNYNEIVASMAILVIESSKIPPLCKLKELTSCEASSFSIDTAYTAVYKAVLQDGATSVSMWM